LNVVEGQAAALLVDGAHAMLFVDPAQQAGRRSRATGALVAVYAGLRLLPPSFQVEEDGTFVSDARAATALGVGGEYARSSTCGSASGNLSPSYCSRLELPVVPTAEPRMIRLYRGNNWNVRITVDCGVSGSNPADCPIEVLYLRNDVAVDMVTSGAATPGSQYPLNDIVTGDSSVTKLQSASGVSFSLGCEKTSLVIMFRRTQTGSSALPARVHFQVAQIDTFDSPPSADKVCLSDVVADFTGVYPTAPVVTPPLVAVSSSAVDLASRSGAVVTHTALGSATSDILASVRLDGDALQLVPTSGTLALEVGDFLNDFAGLGAAGNSVPTGIVSLMVRVTVTDVDSLIFSPTTFEQSRVCVEAFPDVSLDLSTLCLATFSVDRSTWECTSPYGTLTVDSSNDRLICGTPGGGQLLGVHALAEQASVGTTSPGVDSVSGGLGTTEILGIVLGSLAYCCSVLGCCCAAGYFVRRRQKQRVRSGTNAGHGGGNKRRSTHLGSEAPLPAYAGLSQTNSYANTRPASTYNQPGMMSTSAYPAPYANESTMQPVVASTPSGGEERRRSRSGSRRGRSHSGTVNGGGRSAAVAASVYDAVEPEAPTPTLPPTLQPGQIPQTAKMPQRPAGRPSAAAAVSPPAALYDSAHAVLAGTPGATRRATEVEYDQLLPDQGPVYDNVSAMPRASAVQQPDIEYDKLLPDPIQG
jgi:hypothetical protein